MDANETVFRYASLAVLASFFTLRAHFARRLKSERVMTGRAQKRDLTYYQLVGVTYLLTFVYALTPWLDIAHVSLSVGLRWTGVLVAIAGIAMLWWVHRTLGRYWSVILELRENHSLVCSGPYRRIRHPMYTSFFILLVGMALLSANLLLALLQIGTTTAMYLARVTDEEAMMLDRFGDEYRSYMQRTGRLLPHPHE